jgi:hypothetical protein
MSNNTKICPFISTGGFVILISRVCTRVLGSRKKKEEASRDEEEKGGGGH